MGNIQSFQDMTGKMSPSDVNAENIGTIIDEFNRSQDLLDSLNNALKIINKGSGAVSWDGTSGHTGTFVVDVGASVAVTFLCFYTRSDLPNNLYAIPDNELDGSNNTIFIASAFTEGTLLNIQFTFLQNGSPIIFTVYYFIIQQPANPTSN